MLSGFGRARAVSRTNGNSYSVLEDDEGIQLATVAEDCNLSDLTLFYFSTMLDFLSSGAC